jgi:hypothetical protein
VSLFSAIQCHTPQPYSITLLSHTVPLSSAHRLIFIQRESEKSLGQVVFLHKIIEDGSSFDE